MKYRKKPIEVEASQWFKNGDHPRDYDNVYEGYEGERGYRRLMGWEGDIVRYFRNPNIPGTQICKHCHETMHEHGWIDTLEGNRIVCPGDWIITDTDGEHYPCKPDIFEKTYEKVENIESALEKLENFLLESCPHAGPFPYCVECVVEPCPIGLGSKK